MNYELYFATLEGVRGDSFIHRVFCCPDEAEVLERAKWAWFEHLDFLNDLLDEDEDGAVTSNDHPEAIIEVYVFENKYNSSTLCFEPLSKSLKRALNESKPIKHKWNTEKFMFDLVSS